MADTEGQLCKEPEEGVCQRLSGGVTKRLEIQGHHVFSFAPPTSKKVSMKFFFFLLLLLLLGYYYYIALLMEM